MDKALETIILLVTMFMFGGGVVVLVLVGVSLFWKWRLKIRIIKCFSLGLENALTLEEIFILAKRRSLSKFEIQSTLKGVLDTATKLDNLELRKYCLRNLAALDEGTVFDDLPDTIRNNLLKIKGELGGAKEILVINLAENLQDFSKRKTAQKRKQLFLSFVGSVIAAWSVPWKAVVDAFMNFLH